MGDDASDALESLKHYHELLLQDKEKIERFYEEESVEKDRLHAQLSRQTADLRTVLRTARVSNRDTMEYLLGLTDRLRPLGAEAFAPLASVMTGTMG